MDAAGPERRADAGDVVPLATVEHDGAEANRPCALVDVRRERVRIRGCHFAGPLGLGDGGHLPDLDAGLAQGHPPVHVVGVLCVQNDHVVTRLDFEASDEVA